MGNDYQDEMPQEVGDKAKEKTSEQPVGDRKIEEIHDELVSLRDDLSDIRAKAKGAP
jgi:hypothetical protein